MTKTKRFNESVLFQVVLAGQIFFLGVVLLLSMVSSAHALEEDKMQHLTVGCAISTVTNTIMGDDYTEQEKMIAAIVTGSVVGVAKELYDRNHVGHTADYKDALATVAGSALCIKFSLSF